MAITHTSLIVRISPLRRGVNHYLRVFLVFLFAGLRGLQAGDVDEPQLTAGEQEAFRRFEVSSDLENQPGNSTLADLKKEAGTIFGPEAMVDRSIPRLEYYVWRLGGSSSHDFKHCYDGKCIRSDYVEDSPHLLSALEKRFGKGTNGPKYEWMKARDSKVKLGRRVYWERKVTFTPTEGPPYSRNLLFEITAVDGDPHVRWIMSICDTDQADKVAKAMQAK
jgi:hypothetical protein